MYVLHVIISLMCSFCPAVASVEPNASGAAVVSSPRSLLAAISKGYKHIKITQHLDLSGLIPDVAMPAIPDGVAAVFAVPMGTMSIQVSRRLAVHDSRM